MSTPQATTLSLLFPNPNSNPDSNPTTKLESKSEPIISSSKLVTLLTGHSLFSYFSRNNPTPAAPRRSLPPSFRPYVAKVPWHGGARAFLSQLFPRYGHYCGPNWSSGKAGGSMLWDQRPLDWLDFCCYCHDIGYDTHDQAKLLKADLAFLDCLEKPKMPTKGGAYSALLYRSMCITGLRSILIPYRMQLLRLQAGPPSFVQLLNNLIRGNRGNNAFRRDAQ